MRSLDLAIIGAGPTGLEAAARAAREGLSAVLFDAGAAAANVETWGWVRLFSPFALNAGPAGAGLLRDRGVRLPADDAILTGAEFRRRYLLPLAAAVRSGIEVRERACVRDVARVDLLKGEAIASTARGERPFRLLVEEDGVEREVAARAVFDCSGTWRRPGWAGRGGAPARGERRARRDIEYHLPDPLGAQRKHYAGRRTLLLGAGHSAATTAVALATLARAARGTSFIWATRGRSARPLQPIADDPLPERAALIRRANAVAAHPPPGCAWRPGAALRAVAPASGQGFEVELDVGGTVQHDRFDRVVANIGYEPDDGLYRQLQVHTCYASLGPMGVSAALLAAGSDGPADCLNTGDGPGRETLRTPEPGFFILGAKSFGKNSRFLMRTGYEQVAGAFSLLDARPDALHGPPGVRPREAPAGSRG